MCSHAGCSIWTCGCNCPPRTRTGRSASMPLPGFHEQKMSDTPAGDEPHEGRISGLPNGNPSGPAFGPDWPGRRCGAKTRHKTRCLNPGMRNGRCRLHGGLSTGPRTPEGLERSRKARWVHGERSEEALLRGRHLRLIRKLLTGGPREVEMAVRLWEMLTFDAQEGK
jgi:hypothetical protein